MMIEVGTESEWKSPDNKFRTHPVFQLKNIPTVASLKLLAFLKQLIVLPRILSSFSNNTPIFVRLNFDLARGPRYRLEYLVPTWTVKRCETLEAIHRRINAFLPLFGKANGFRFK
ncbi:hypothetical protein FGIG_05656 [Fasciola gigantica]|uniref:Uncharacterized protein n=1 Tax=Fasciola gigantica TaxID=46835 RepID=A0A504YAJ1_FASGI|nr:hypothetical protein FGIG_05656 [Fasciola gigantica]